MKGVQQYDLNKVDIQKEKVDLKNFVKNIYKDFRHVMKEKSLDFIFDDKVTTKTADIEIDKSQMRQVIHNILNNAYKFTHKGGEISLFMKKNEDGYLIKISDSGKGVPEADKKRIFEKFQTNNRTAGGIGLGLYICKKIIELHGGKIWMEDSDQGGAAFCILLKK